MDRTDDYLDQLDAHLAALPEESYAMSVSELDGYVTGLLACPADIPVEDWLPAVWGEAGEAGFASAEAAAETKAAVLSHYDTIAAALKESSWIEPIYEMDPETEEIIWGPWVDGFTRALRLRAEVWQQIIETTDEETRAGLLYLMALQDINEGESEFEDEELDQIDAEAPDTIPESIEAILAATRPEFPRAG